jgi:hypothetical protein
MKRPIWQALIKPSTAALYREGRQTPGYSFWDWVHGYVYGRWTYLYIGIGTGEHWLAKTLVPLINRISGLIPVLKPNSWKHRYLQTDTAKFSSKQRSPGHVGEFARQTWKK